MSSEHGRIVNVALIGFGNVGTGVVRYFQEGRGEPFNLHLKRVAVANLSKPRKIQFSPLTDNPTDIFKDPSIDIVVELMGGVDVARKYTLDAIDGKKSVVNANKALLARHMREIFDAARSRGVNLGFEASVAGGIQIINTLSRLRGERINSIRGIINGTTNYILTRMTDYGLSFEPALKEAQDKGYAEADPTADIQGYDAQNKLAVLASLAFNTQVDVDRILRIGITGISPVDIDFAGKYGVDEGGRGYTIKLLAIAQRHGDDVVELGVNPVIISKDHPLASVRDAFNAVHVEGELAGAQMYYGRGAGESPTTSAVISDILAVAENIRRDTTIVLPTLDSEVTYIDPREVTQRGYIKVYLKHKPGSIARISSILAAHGLNIEDSIQRRRFAVRENGVIYIPDIITFESAPRRDIDAALQEISRSNRVYGAPFYMPFAE